VNAKMKYLSYIVARDYGFAPNPFHNTCTLATCKPKLRKAAKIGDWIIGTGSVQHKSNGKLVFAMQVSEKLTYDEYWNDERFISKRPVMEGSLKLMYGDNIYHSDESNNWMQENSHHALENGGLNEKNLKTDTGGMYVLISSKFYYFGKKCIDISQDILSDICCSTQGWKYVNEQSGASLIAHLEQNYLAKRLGFPLQLSGKFKRYEGNK